MKYFIKSIFIICFLFYSFLSAQNKYETESWIIETVSQYPGGPIDNRKLKIIDGYITYFEKIGDTIFYDRILIKNIKEIQVLEKYSEDWGNYYSIKLFCAK